MKIRSIVPATAIVILLAHTTAAVAADVQVLSTFGMKEVLNEITPEFERATGHKLVVQYGSSGGLKQQIEGGETFDVAMITPSIIDDLTAQGRIAAGTRATIARSIAIAFAPCASAARAESASLARTMIGVWLWRHAVEGAALTRN